MEDQAEARQSLAIPIPGISSGNQNAGNSSDPRFPVLKLSGGQTAADKDCALD
jgi:hypothetical protein